MLPASLQTPAAIVLVVGGLLSCFAGYRIFRVVLGIYGFILGALLASSFMGSEQTLWMIVAAIGGGLAGAAILIFAYFVGVALIGAGVGALTANVVWATFGTEPGMLAVILFAIVGALGALALQRYVIILSTAFGGAWTAMVGGFALAGDRVANQATAKSDVWLAYPLNPAPGQRWVLFAWFVFGLIGALVRVGTSGQRKRD
jgi:hypothetical protein